MKLRPARPCGPEHPPQRIPLQRRKRYEDRTANRIAEGAVAGGAAKDGGHRAAFSQRRHSGCSRVSAGAADAGAHPVPHPTGHEGGADRQQPSDPRYAGGAAGAGLLRKGTGRTAVYHSGHGQPCRRHCREAEGAAGGLRDHRGVLRLPHLFQHGDGAGGRAGQRRRGACGPLCPRCRRGHCGGAHQGAHLLQRPL